MCWNPEIWRMNFALSFHWGPWRMAPRAQLLDRKRRPCAKLSVDVCQHRGISRKTMFDRSGVPLNWKDCQNLFWHSCTRLLRLAFRCRAPAFPSFFNVYFVCTVSLVQGQDIKDEGPAYVLPPCLGSCHVHNERTKSARIRQRPWAVCIIGVLLTTSKSPGAKGLKLWDTVRCRNSRGVFVWFFILALVTRLHARKILQGPSPCSLRLSKRVQKSGTKVSCRPVLFPGCLKKQESFATDPPVAGHEEYGLHGHGSLYPGAMNLGLSRSCWQIWWVYEGVSKTGPHKFKLRDSWAQFRGKVQISKRH